MREAKSSMSKTFLRPRSCCGAILAVAPSRRRMRRALHPATYGVDLNVSRCGGTLRRHSEFLLAFHPGAKGDGCVLRRMCRDWTGAEAGKVPASRRLPRAIGVPAHRSATTCESFEFQSRLLALRPRRPWSTLEFSRDRRLRCRARREVPRLNKRPCPHGVSARQHCTASGRYKDEKAQSSAETLVPRGSQTERGARLTSFSSPMF